MASTNNSKNVINFVKNRKHNLIQVFGGKCCLCNFNSFVEALEFHHVHPEDKEFPLSSNIMKSLDKQLKEARKCVLLCANCHRGVHAGILSIPENYQDFYDEDVAQQLLQITEDIKQGKKHYCIDCGKLIPTAKAERCELCARKASRTVSRPNRNELKKLIRTLPFTQIGKQYGVTDNAIRKWCLVENLPSKKSEINKFSEEEWEKI